MRFHCMLLFLIAGVMLLAKSDGDRTRKVEVRTSNSSVEIIGSDVDQVVVDDPEGANVSNVDGRALVVTQDRPLKVQVPRGAALEVITSNGTIRVSGVEGAMQLSSSNGAIVVQTAVRAEMHVHTSNGRIEIGVSKGLNADVTARTSNGRVHYDVEVVTRRLEEDYLEGRIGSGGPRLDFETSNGAIYLKNGSDRESVVSTFTPGDVK